MVKECKHLEEASAAKCEVKHPHNRFMAGTLNYVFWKIYSQAPKKDLFSSTEFMCLFHLFGIIPVCSES